MSDDPCYHDEPPCEECIRAAVLAEREFIAAAADEQAAHFGASRPPNQKS